MAEVALGVLALTGEGGFSPGGGRALTFDNSPGKSVSHSGSPHAHLQNRDMDALSGWCPIGTYSTQVNPHTHTQEDTL